MILILTTTLTYSFTETIRESTGGVTPDIDWLIHDVKMLLVRFATQAKFHLDSGGGGPESNLKLIPYLLQASLYVLNQTKQHSLHTELVDNYLGEVIEIFNLII